jgi:adenylosuccinate lyase
MNPKALNPDVLCDRYASSAMAAIWSPRAKIVLERELWIAVMRAQRQLGIDIPEEAIRAYERVRDDVDLTRIQARERVTRHDVKARIDEFCELAGYEHIHKGLTSRDLTENVEQLQVLRGLRLLRAKSAASLIRLADRVVEYRSAALTARTHNVPAQLTTVGKRLAMFGAEMLSAHAGLETLLGRYPLRGLKGAVGTQLDLLTLFGDDAAKVEDLELRIARELGFEDVMFAVGQVYPRGLDFEVLSALYRLANGPGSFAKTMRLMTGQELVSEGFASGQVGSSAMPHKLNPRSCERINGLHVVLGGFLSMTASISGDQWNEGDVSCSVVRRVALPGSMFAIDGILETFLTVAGEMEFFPARVAEENRRWLPFLATTTILMEAVKRGLGREAVHAAIKDHAVAAAKAIRSADKEPVDLIARLAADARVGLSQAELERLLRDDGRFVGSALAQADEFVARVEVLKRNIPESASCAPEPLL